MYLSFFSCNSDLLMTITAQQVTRFKFALNVLVEEGLGFFDKFTQTNNLRGCVAVIEIKRAARLQCHTERTSQAFTTTQLLGGNDRAAFEYAFSFPSTPFAVGFQSVTPAT
jgi:hypothetical protein